MYNKRSSGDKDSMLNMASTRVCTFGTVRYRPRCYGEFEKASDRWGRRLESKKIVGFGMIYRVFRI